MNEESDRFTAKGTSGRTYVIVELQHIVESRTLGGVSHAKGLKEYVLENGGHVNMEDDGTFTIVQTDEVLTRE